jgi:hypothetical protein
MQPLSLDLHLMAIQFQSSVAADLELYDAERHYRKRHESQPYLITLHHTIPSVKCAKKTKKR